MIDKKISVGTVITIITIVATCIYTQGIMTNRIEVTEDKSDVNFLQLNSNREKIQELEVSVGKIEAKIDEGFKRLETLLIEN